MKKVLLFMTILVSLNLRGQSYMANYSTQDLYLAYGMMASNRLFASEDPLLSNMLPDNRYVFDHPEGIGILTLGYQHLLKNQRLWLGMNMSYQQTRDQVYYLGSDLGLLNRKYLVLAADVNVRWINRDLIQIYSGLSLGYMMIREDFSSSNEEAYISQSSSINSLAWQAKLFGIRIGHKLGGFAEAGIGYQGVIKVGLSYQPF